MIQRICLLTTLFIFVFSNVYALNREKLILNMELVYNNFREIRNTYKDNSIVDAISYYDNYFDKRDTLQRLS